MIAAALVTLLALLAQATVSEAQSCLADLPAGLQESQVACGVGSFDNGTSPTLICANSATELKNNKLVHKGSPKPGCFLVLSPNAKNGLVLLLTPSMMVAAGYSGTTRILLHKSVSLLVGVDKMLTLQGQAIASVNPEIFQSIGDTQKRKLKTLALFNTLVESVDASLLQPLNISALALFDNSRLTKFTNYDNVQLPALQELHLKKFNSELMDCRSFKSLPPSIKRMYLFPESWSTLSTANNCSFCSLPRAISEVFVETGVTQLPHHPGASEQRCFGPPYPLGRPVPNAQVGTIPCKKVTVSATSASGCDACGDCDPWQITTTTTTTTTTTSSSSEKEIEKNKGAVAAGGGTRKSTDGGGGGGGGSGSFASMLLVTATFAVAAAAGV